MHAVISIKFTFNLFPKTRFSSFYTHQCVNKWTLDKTNMKSLFKLEIFIAIKIRFGVFFEVESGKIQPKDPKVSLMLSIKSRRKEIKNQTLNIYEALPPLFLCSSQSCNHFVLNSFFAAISNVQKRDF